VTLLSMLSVVLAATQFSLLSHVLVVSVPVQYCSNYDYEVFLSCYLQQVFSLCMLKFIQCTENPAVGSYVPTHESSPNTSILLS
jgi:hypothetical protein